MGIVGVTTGHVCAAGCRLPTRQALPVLTVLLLLLACSPAMLTVALQARAKTMHMQCHMIADMYHAQLDQLHKKERTRFPGVADTTCTTTSL